MSKKGFLNIVLIFELIFFILIITGILPRVFSIYLTAGLLVYVLIASLEDATILFAISIPFFLALPLTENFDNFNTWRILSLVIFLKWFYSYFTFQALRFTNLKKIKTSSLLLVALLIFATLSITQAPDRILAIKRIIYFVNLGLIGIVIYDLIRKNENFAQRLIKNLSIPTIIVALVGLAQVASTYFIDIYQFMRIWGEGIQLRQFGSQWSYIATHVGNTWFAYYGDQLSLRIFSLFPDSHSFPIFLLLGLPSIFVIAFRKLIPESYQNLKSMIRTRGNLCLIFVPLIFLAAILSGTRGIWAASIGVIIVILFITRLLHKENLKTEKSIFTYISLYLILFYLLFTIAYPIFVSPQFLLSKGNFALFGSRIKSIVDFGETSNSQRLEIWEKSFVSIKKHPFLGVGIGNFPVVLGQKLALAKAGSSAHNLYLHIAAEMGIPALLVALWFLWLLVQKAYYNFIYSKSMANRKNKKIYNAAILVFIPWVLIYSLTDSAILDERAFLMFVTIAALILATKNVAD